MVKKRVLVQSSPEWDKKLKKIQTNLMKKGKKISIRDLTEEVARSKTLEEVEARLMKTSIDAEIGINFDIRR